MKMFVNNLLDTYLPKIGLVRRELHENINDGWKTYTYKLGAVAKDKGVNVIFDHECFENKNLDSDLFILGSQNYLENNRFIGATTHLAPGSKDNYSTHNYFTHNAYTETAETAKPLMPVDVEKENEVE